jgi:hypothetical protein
MKDEIISIVAICGLFNDIVSTSDSIVLDDTMTNK